LPLLATGMDIASDVVPGAAAAESSIFSLVFQRGTVHDKEPHIPFGRFGQVLLGNDIAIAAHGLDHLIEVSQVVLANQKYALAAGTLQRLNDDVFPQILGE